MNFIPQIRSSLQLGWQRFDHTATPELRSIRPEAADTPTAALLLEALRLRPIAI